MTTTTSTLVSRDVSQRMTSTVILQCCQVYKVELSKSQVILSKTIAKHYMNQIFKYNKYIIFYSAKYKIGYAFKIIINSMYNYDSSYFIAYLMFN